MKRVDIYIKNIFFRKILNGLSVLTIVFIVLSCEDFVEIDPPRNETITDEVFALDDTAEGAVNGIYTSFLGFSTLFDAANEVYTGVLADEFTSFSSFDDFQQFSSNEILPEEPTVFTTFWQEPYISIFRANSAIEGLEKNEIITTALRDQLLGEALFLRAFVHFYLVNLFGDIPYIMTTDVEVNTNASREPLEQVYSKIESDLLRAKELLSDDFSFVEANERIRANRAAATLVLARMYLYTGDWVSAIVHASEVIEDPLFILEPDLDDVFLATSREAIWQLRPRSSSLRNNDTRIGNSLVLDNPPGVPANVFPQVVLNDVQIAVFEPGDARLDQWIGSAFGFSFSNKYKNTQFTAPRTEQEYTALLRLGEAFLIRAEAHTQLGNLSAAIIDLDIIRERAQLGSVLDTNPGISQQDLLEAIYREKQIEFLAEGHRWFDLKRTGRVDVVLRPLKENWEPTDALLPIPETEILNNSNLTQNPGY